MYSCIYSLYSMYSLCWYHTHFFEMCYVLMFTPHLKSLKSKLWHANKEPLLGQLVSSENLPNKVMLQNLHESVSHDPGGCWVNHKCWQTQTERECQKRESLFITEISGKWEGIGGGSDHWVHSAVRQRHWIFVLMREQRQSQRRHQGLLH